MPIFDHAWAWIIAGAVLAGLEIVAPGVYLLWIGLGALMVGIFLALAPEMAAAWQGLVFAAAMLGSVGIGFWLQRRTPRQPGEEMLNRETQALVGRRFTAITGFELGRGRIRIGDGSYAAVSEQQIQVGDVVEVVAIEDGRPKVVRTQPLPESPRAGPPLSDAPPSVATRSDPPPR